MSYNSVCMVTRDCMAIRINIIYISSLKFLESSTKSHVVVLESFNELTPGKTSNIPATAIVQ